MSPRNSWKPFTVVSALALACAALGVSASSTASADDEAQAEQVIVVHGWGEVHARPDSLRFDVGVEGRAPTVEDARTKVNGVLRQVLDAMHGLGIADLSTETKVLQVNPIYAVRREDQVPAIVGYAASNHVDVTIERAPVDELGDRGARVLDAALTAGANSIGGLDFFLSDPTPIQDEALAAAVDDALRDAATIARSAGVALGPMLSLEEEAGIRISPHVFALEAMASTPIEVEDVVAESRVTARFTFREARSQATP